MQEGAMDRLIKRITKERLAQMIEESQLQLVDLRLNWESSAYKIKNATHQNPRDTSAWPQKYDRNRTIVLYCSTPQEKTSLDVASILEERGFTDVRVLIGGWLIWKAANLPVQKKDKEPTPARFVKGVLSD
jgi:rhodanese-related sulfurtransferase